MDFDYRHYYRYNEMVDFLQRQAERYPHLMQLEAIGQSNEAHSHHCVALYSSCDKCKPLRR